jgi:DNA-binding XRE family transcriptional regulator
MNYQYALVRMMEEKNLSIYDVATNTDWSVRYAAAVAENTGWHPCFDSVLRLCYGLRLNVFTFFEFAEVGIRGQSPITGHQTFLRSLEVQRELILFMEPLHVSLALRSLRLERGMTQKELSQLTAFSTPSISMREGTRYMNFPTMTTVEYYCEAFGISVYSFVFEVFLRADSLLSSSM